MKKNTENAYNKEERNLVNLSNLSIGIFNFFVQEVICMIWIDPEQYCIIIPKGDTGLFTVNIFDSYVNEETDMAVFAVWRKNQINEQPLIKKVLPIIDGAVVILITEDDTKDIRGGDYNWDVMLFKNIKGSGELEEDESISNVFSERHSLLSDSHTGLPTFRILEVNDVGI